MNVVYDIESRPKLFSDLYTYAKIESKEYTEEGIKIKTHTKMDLKLKEIEMHSVTLFSFDKKTGLYKMEDKYIEGSGNINYSESTFTAKKVTDEKEEVVAMYYSSTFDVDIAHLPAGAVQAALKLGNYISLPTMLRTIVAQAQTPAYSERDEDLERKLRGQTN